MGPLASQKQYRVVDNPCLPLYTNISPASTMPRWADGINVLTSNKGYCERRPGTSAMETIATTFAAGATISRVFVWRKWASVFVWMVNVTTATTSKVYKYVPGTDTTLQLIFTASAVDGAYFDFVESNNHVFFCNGTAADAKKYDATTVTNWGITAPASAPTFTLSGTGIDAAVGYYYVTTYYNPATGHESSPSTLSACTGVFTNNQVNVTLVASADAQVTQIRVYRSTDGGSTDTTDMREISNSPFTNANGVVVDTTTDTSLSTRTAPARYYNDRPPGIKGLIAYAGRIWGIANNKLYFSGAEEISNGVQEECWWTATIDGNFYSFPAAANGVAAMTDGVAVFLSTSIWKIEGDRLTNFNRYKIADRQGAPNQRCIATLAGSIFWFDTSKTIWQLGGVEIGLPIRDYLLQTDINQVSLAIHVDGPHRWLCLLDHTGLLNVFDFDTRQWMPRWTIAAKSIFSGEFNTNTISLAFGGTSGKLLKLDTTVYTDDGVTPTAPSLKTGLIDIAPEQQPDYRGYVNQVSIQRDTSALSDVGLLIDDDPSVTHTSYFANERDADLRTQGTALLQKDYPIDPLVGRQVSVEFGWPAATTNFKFYSFHIGFKHIGV